MENKNVVPSIDAWLKEAKADPSAEKIGMYLTHNGVVRRTAKAKVRQGDESAADIIIDVDNKDFDTILDEIIEKVGEE